MTQVLPQVQVYQEFTLVPTAVIIPLRAFIFGPHYNVRSYSKAKSSISLGAYDYTEDVAYNWPGRLAGEIVDQAFTQLFVDAAWIRYFNYAGATNIVASVAPNILRIASSGWQALTGYARHASVPRDVAIGDAVVVTDPDDSSSTVTAKVRSVAREPVASSHGSTSTASAGNKTTTASGSTPVSAPSGPFTATITATGYKPYKVGLTGDRYTFKITTAGGTGVAKMAVTTDSGLDSEYDVTVTTGGALTVGDLGLQITFVDSGTSTFNLNDKWVFDVTCDFTATVGGDLAFTGTYTGATTTSYVVTVTEGGVVDTDTPKVSVRTADGSDAGGPYDAAAAAFTIGGLGLSLAVGTGVFLSKGDTFSVSVVAASSGRVRDLVLDQSLPAALVLSDVAVQISAIRDQEVLANRYNQPNVKNWTQAATAITVESGILSYSTETDLNGYPIVAGTLYASYRALAQTYVSDIQTVSDVSALSALFSDLTPENPLAYGLKKALENANGTDVKFIAVATDNLAGYTTAVNKTLEREDMYSFVPLTKNRDVLSMVAGHVTQQSTPEKGRWRIAWVTETNATTKQIVGATQSLATIAHDTADVAGTYRLVTCATATFITDGVTAGDTFEYNFAVDAVGAATYSTDVVDSVISETQLKILTGPAAAVAVAEKIEVWRNLTASAQCDELALLNSYGSRRVYNVLAGNQNDADGYSNVDDMYLAAAFAGLRSGVLAHQGLTNVELAGFTTINWTMVTLTGTDRDTLMNAGYWVVQQNTEGAGEVYCRKQLSTDLTSLNTTEQSVTTNVDSVSYYLKSILAPYIGRTNNVETVQSLIRGDVEAAFQVFFNNATPTLGSQLLDGTVITDLRTHATLRDRLVIEIALVIPYPLNNIDCYLVI